jgi:virulence factor Mce-like protein
VPDAAELTAANSEVRIRGTRVGIVKEIQAIPARGSKRALARLTLALDISVGKLPVDTQTDVRPRSVLGAKYLEVIPGHSKRTIPDGGLIPVTQARPVVEFDEAFNVFDKETSEGLRNTTNNLGDALAGRGDAINRSALAVRRLIGPLQNVLGTLADPATNLAGFIRALAAVTSALVPVTRSLGSLIDNGATTLAALDVARGPLGETIDELPPTELVSTRALRTIKPVISDAAAIAREIRPGSALIKPATKELADALDDTTPVLLRVPDLGDRLKRVLDGLDTLVENSNTNDVVKGLITTTNTLSVSLPDLVPPQLQCNVAGTYGKNLTAAVSEGDAVGTWLNGMFVIDFNQILQSPQPADNLHLNFYPHENYNECESGNEPFRGGQRIGNPGGQQPRHTKDTHP